MQMTRLVESCQAEAGSRRIATSDPYSRTCRGRMLFELDGDKSQQIVAGQAFSKPGNYADALPNGKPRPTQLDPVFAV
jgi:hypothetical protein